MKKVIKKSKYTHKQWFRATINGDECVGRVSVEGNTIYLCQDVHDGSNADDKLGFTYSWQVGNGNDDLLKLNDVANLQLLSRKPVNIQPPLILPNVGAYRTVLKSDGETINVGCTPVSRELYLKVGRLAGWIE